MIDSIDLELLWKTGAFIQSTNTGIIVILVYIVMQLVISYIRPKKKKPLDMILMQDILKIA